MAKKNKSKSKAKKQLPPPSPSPSESPESSEDEMNYKSERVTLEQIDAMSDGEEDEIQEWNAEAKALRQAIADGVFDNLKLNSVDQGDDDEEDSDEEEEEGQEEANEEQEEGQDDQSESESEEDEEEEETDKKPIMKRGISNEKALASVTNTLLTEHAALQWPEKFDIVPSTPLPFGTLDAEGQPIMVHDDLKREVAFYNLALDAVHLARKECHKFDIPFTRPEDFFAEMVKTDAHMAMVKDRLIFESKKMEAFEQRKSNREQKLRAKEKHAHRLAEKAKAKKQHMKDVQDWADTAANSRVGGGRVRDDDADYLNRMNGPNKKRMAANKKYGHGGKRGRFKQNDAKSMNDMSGFNPKGNFAGGQKAGANKRKGKRARDASKARR